MTRDIVGFVDYEINSSEEVLSVFRFDNAICALLMLSSLLSRNLPE